MPWSVSVDVELDPGATVEEMERVMLAAGQQAMRQALCAAVDAYERAHPACGHCGSAASRSQGTVPRRVLTRFGRVVVALRRQRCQACGRRFRPAAGCLARLGPGKVTPDLGAACALAGASWPYATAARVLHDLCGAQVSHEAVRQWTVRQGAALAQTQQAEAEALLAPTAAHLRAARDAQTRARRGGQGGQLGRVGARAPGQPASRCPERLTVGLDGGWLPSREQVGGMEGKVGVVATGMETVGKHGRHRLTPRRYVATFADSEQVGALAYAAAVALGGDEAREQLVLGDGAEWIKTQADLHFPDARGILDWAHVSRAIHKAIRAARPGPASRALRRDLHRTVPDALWHGDLSAALTALSALRPAPPADPIPVLEETLRYLDHQRGWLGDYATWQQQGYPVGSGLIERAVAIVINWRMKGRGMRWCRHNASAVVALRVRTLNATKELGNDTSPLAA
jgi:hypothetical protein